MELDQRLLREAQKVLDAVGTKFGHVFNYTEVDMGGVSIDKHGVPLTDEALATAQKSDAVLLGAVGGVVGKTVGTNFHLTLDRRQDYLP